MQKLTLMIRSLLVAIVFGLFTGVIPVRAQLNIGYMDPQAVMDTMPARDDVEQRLNQFVKKKRSQLKQRTVNFQKRIARLQKEAQNAGPQRSQVLQDSLNALNRRLQQYRRSIQQQLQRRRAKMLQPLYDQIDKAIAAVAERRNLDFVINQSTSRGESIIFYAESDKLNITNEVINEILSQQ